ncbi:MAG: hypothetical protein K8T91_02565 [Planctomycetes bacterium]|nr:hypothetical protein [Planctomycetota bacterium]
MDSKQLSPKDRQALDEALGYLNFSTGASDRQFLANLNQLCRTLAGTPSERRGKKSGNLRASLAVSYQELAALLRQRLDELSQQEGTFSDATQARRVIDLFEAHVLRNYLEFHRDLLAHQNEATLINPLFCGRVFEAILLEVAARGGDGEPAALSAAIVTRLNDYVGHRPLATLETRRTEPYPHEWHRPLPLYIRGVGAAAGPYEELVAQAVAILDAADPELLASADFDPKLLEEVAMDARGYDFDHPVNKRPNYHFGHWDPNRIDSRGHYRRYVVRQEILDALLRRVEQPSPASAESLMFESAAALAGTMLMSAELGGSGPSAHSSDVTLGTLMPRIAAHRDRFYEELLKQKGADQARLRADANERRQPFGGVRQYLNAELARMRAAQLEHVHLAKLLARIGQVEAAARQAAAVPTARARMVCQIQCLLTASERALDLGEIDQGTTLVAEAVALLHRAIQCGAVVDPWNILGSDAQFSLFPALENSVYDHRVDELLELVSMIFETLSRGWTLAAAAGNSEVSERLEVEMTRLATWWDKFATTSVSSVEGVAAGALCEAAAAVAEALAAWHGGGTTAGDIGFWRPYVARFDSPKAFVLVIDALLDRGDFVASMALLMQWLSEADRVPLQVGDASFHAVAGRWLRELLSDQTAERLPATERWRLVVRFFDSIEANADQWGQAPKLSSGGVEASATQVPRGLLDDMDPREATADADDDDSEVDLFSAAYDGMVFRDSTDDGIDQDLLGAPGEGQATDHELEHESRRIGARLAFLVTLSQLWRHTAEQVAVGSLTGAETSERLASWLDQLKRIREQLGELLLAAARQPIPNPGGSSDSLLLYDRLRWIKDALTEQVIATSVRCEEAALLVAAAIHASQPKPTEAAHQVQQGEAVARVLGELIRGDAAAVQQLWPQLLDALAGQPLLYVPLGKAGDPQKILAARSFQRLVRMLLSLLPRLGLLVETGELLHLAPIRRWPTAWWRRTWRDAPRTLPVAIPRKLPTRN